MIYNDFDDQERGRDCMLKFHNAMAYMYPDKYKISFDELLRYVNSRGNKLFVQGLGTGIIAAEMSGVKVQDTMEALAKQSGGKMPASNSAFTQALINSSQKFNFIDMGKTVVIETSKDILRGAEAVGNGVLSVGKGAVNTLNLAQYFIPILVIGGLGFFVYSRAK